MKNDPILAEIGPFLVEIGPIRAENDPFEPKMDQNWIWKSVNRNSMSSTHDSGLCSSSDISTAGHSGHFSDIEYEKSLGRKSKSQVN